MKPRQNPRIKSASSNDASVPIMSIVLRLFSLSIPFQAQAAMPVIRRVGFVVLFLATLMAAPLDGNEASAEPTDEEAVQFIAELSLKAIASLTDKEIAPKDRDQAFRVLLRNALDMDIIARRVLGVYARRATPEVLERLKPVLEETFVLTYAHRFESYDGQQIEVNGTREGRRKTLIVETIVTQSDTDVDIPVDWHLTPDANRFRIVDIVINKTFSMVETHRDQYVPIINRSGGDIDALIDALDKHNAKVAEDRL